MTLSLSSTRAAAVDVAAVPRRAERRERPLRRIDVDDVGVRHQQQRTLRAASLEAGDQVQPVRLELEDLRRDAFAIEHLLEVLGGGSLVARRIARVDPEHRLKVLHRFGSTRDQSMAVACATRETVAAQSAMSRKEKGQRCLFVIAALLTTV